MELMGSNGDMMEKSSKNGDSRMGKSSINGDTGDMMGTSSSYIVDFRGSNGDFMDFNVI